MAKKYCIVKSCESNSYDKTISLFSFPSCCSKEWIDAVGREEGWLPKKNSKICSKHFAPHMIRNRHLLPGAVPHQSSSVGYTSASIGLGTVILYSVIVHIKGECHDIFYLWILSSNSLF